MKDISIWQHWGSCKRMAGKLINTQKVLKIEKQKIWKFSVFNFWFFKVTFFGLRFVSAKNVVQQIWSVSQNCCFIVNPVIFLSLQQCLFVYNGFWGSSKAHFYEVESKFHFNLKKQSLLKSFYDSLLISKLRLMFELKDCFSYFLYHLNTFIGRVPSK